MNAAALIDLILERCEAERMLRPLKTRLVKLLYLIEVEYYRRTGKRLTDLRWKFHHFGPYAPALSEHLGNPNVDLVAWSISHRPHPADHNIEKCVSQVVHEWGDADLNALLDYVYFDTEPMQATKRGEALDFSVVRPLAEQRRTRIELDSKKLKALRRDLATRAADYEQLRAACEVSESLFENLKEWDIDRALKLANADCKIDPKSLL